MRSLAVLAVLLAGCSTHTPSVRLSVAGSLPSDLALAALNQRMAPRHAAAEKNFRCRFHVTEVEDVDRGVRWPYRELTLVVVTEPIAGGDRFTPWVQRQAGGSLSYAANFCMFPFERVSDVPAERAAHTAGLDRLATAWVSLGGRLQSDD